MAMDEARARYLRDKVLTATPAQRVVLLYDRLGLDLTLADGAENDHSARQHVSHAMQIVAELRASLDVTAGGPAENLAAIYGYLLRALLGAQAGDNGRLAEARRMVGSLRDAWAQVGELVGTQLAQRPVAPVGHWVG